MSLTASKISKSIREKKKKMMSAEPELVDTDARPDMNPQDLMDITQKARIEDTLMTPEKINADDTNMNESYQGIDESPEEMGRMKRLKAYFDTLDI